MGSGIHKVICMRKHIPILILSDSIIQTFCVMIAAFWEIRIYGDTVLRHIIKSIQSVLGTIEEMIMNQSYYGLVWIIFIINTVKTLYLLK